MSSCFCEGEYADSQQDCPICSTRVAAMTAPHYPDEPGVRTEYTCTNDGKVETRTFYQYDWLDRITQITYPTVNGLTLNETEYHWIVPDDPGYLWDVFLCFPWACFCSKVQGFRGPVLPTSSFIIGCSTLDIPPLQPIAFNLPTFQLTGRVIRSSRCLG